MSSPLAGAEMITFFAPASMCARASSALVNRPVDSTTTSTPRSRHGSFAGSRSARILICFSPARIVSPATDTSSGSVPSRVSYFSRCAIVAMSPRSLAATTSMSPSGMRPAMPMASALTARQKFRPIRPNPLIPTRMVTALFSSSITSRLPGRAGPPATVTCRYPAAAGSPLFSGCVSKAALRPLPPGSGQLGRVQQAGGPMALGGVDLVDLAHGQPVAGPGEDLDRLAGGQLALPGDAQVGAGPPGAGEPAGEARIAHAD